MLQLKGLLREASEKIEAKQREATLKREKERVQAKKELYSELRRPGWEQECECVVREDPNGNYLARNPESRLKRRVKVTSVCDWHLRFPWWDNELAEEEPQTMSTVLPPRKVVVNIVKANASLFKATVKGAAKTLCTGDSIEGTERAALAALKKRRRGSGINVVFSTPVKPMLRKNVSRKAYNKKKWEPVDALWICPTIGCCEKFDSKHEAIEHSEMEHA